jgi:hypothetical protein
MINSKASLKALKSLNSAARGPDVLAVVRPANRNQRTRNRGVKCGDSQRRGHGDRR